MHTSSEHKSIQLRLYTALLKHLFELKLMAFLGIVICMSVHIWRLLFSHTNLTRMGSQFEALYTYSNICSLVYGLLTPFLSMVRRTHPAVCLSRNESCKSRCKMIATVGFTRRYVLDHSGFEFISKLRSYSG